MEMMLSIHLGLSRAAAYFMLMLGVWGLVRAVRGRSVEGDYLGSLVAGELLIVAQTVIGIALIFGGSTPARASVHYLYGAFSAVFLPFLFAYIRGDDTNRGQWIYTFGTFFMFGVMIRQTITGL